MFELLAFVFGATAGGLALWLWARGEIARRDERLELLARSEGQWEEHLQALTGTALRQSTSSLLELAEAKLLPVKETLDRFEAQAQALEAKRIAEVSAIPALLRSANETQEALRKETGNLVTALRAPEVRGRWGEMQLKRVVELAGMLEQCDFDTQPTVRTPDGNLLRPDLVVHLAGGKHVVVDAKTPLDAYLDAIATDDPQLRTEHLTRHARLVREHIAKLGQKQYWKHFTPAPEFVVMFIADEAFWRAALDHDPTLLDAGAESGVIPASPTTLIALLRTVAYGWQQETVAESARAVNQLGRELYDRLRVFAGHFASVGKSLNTAVGNYNNAVGSFDTRVSVTARRFSELGVGGDEIPEVPPITTQARPVLSDADGAADETVPGKSTLEKPVAAKPAAEKSVAEQTVIELPARTADAA